MNYKLNLVIFIFFFLSTIVLAFSGGSGTISDPFIITNCIELQEVHNINNLEKAYILGNDINCYNETRLGGTLYNNGEGFNPIGHFGYYNFNNYVSPFTGTFNGKNFVISNLTINRPNFDSVALFASTQNASIQNVGLENALITGWNIVSSLVANSDSSTIINTYNKNGLINGAGIVGGLIGRQQGNSVLINSYNTGNVLGRYYNEFAEPNNIGGLIGFSESLINPTKNCFSTGRIVGTNAIDGLIGSTSLLPINSYWFDVLDDNATSCSGCIKSNSINNFYSKNYGVYINTPIWDGNWFWSENSFPVLKKMMGEGTISDPFIITNCIQLQNINNNLNAHYILGSDIDCSDTINWNNGSGFIPIGGAYSNFKGSLDGNYKVITNLYINIPVSRNLAGPNDFVGLFCLVDGAKLRNIGLKDANITGAVDVGGFIGRVSIYSPTELTNLYFDGELTGTDEGAMYGVLSTVGGIIGTTWDKVTLKNSFSTGKINSSGYGGGLIGSIQGSNIINSYSLMSITAPYAGGLGGFASGGSIINSFSTTNLSGNTTSPIVAKVNNNYNSSNLYCLNSSAPPNCTFVSDPKLIYPNTHQVYNSNPSWDNNWVWTESFFPQLNTFPYCRGPIDGNAVIYQGDWTGLKPTDNLINVLSNSNTSRTCEWKCKEGFEISSNKCVPINYTCTGDIDSNAIVFEGDNEGLVENLDKNLVEADGNTSRKCEYYCKEGYYKSGNSCIAYTCINPIDNASYYEGDNLGLILSGEVNSVLSNSNEDRKCEMFCDTNYHREGVACVRDVEVFSCIGTIPNNAELWDEEEELELVVNVTRTLSAIDTQTKCEYKCSNNFKQFNDTCVPKDYVVASCGFAKRNYYPTDDFPIGSLCSIGNPFPSNPALGENINDSTSWICVGDVNASCSAKRVDYGEPIYDACVLKELNVGRDEKGGFFVEPLCDCETELDLSLIDYNNSSNLQINPSKITCRTYPQKTGIGFSPPLTKDTLIQVTGSIKNHVECTNCELVTYYNYVLEKENSFVPDNSFVSLLLVIGVISFVLTRRKRI